MHAPLKIMKLFLISVTLFYVVVVTVDVASFEGTEVMTKTLFWFLLGTNK